MDEGDGCRYVGVDVSLGRVMEVIEETSTLILEGLLLPDCFVSCVLCFSY